MLSPSFRAIDTPRKEVCPMNLETKIYQIPEFTGENIPVKEAARIMGKDIEYVRIGIIEGFLPIGTAFKKKGSSIYTYYISPRKF